MNSAPHGAMQEARSPAVTSQRIAVIRRPDGLFYCAAARRRAGRARRAPERISARDVHRDEGLALKGVARCKDPSYTLPASIYTRRGTCCDSYVYLCEECGL